ncbi:MAG: hypothetical protein RRB18_07475 [Sulfolobaceae archaeon]|nr:hypothetical protein [Sulfolobaceae archaeon]
MITEFIKKGRNKFFAYALIFAFLASLLLAPNVVLSHASSSKAQVNMVYERYYSSYSAQNGLGGNIMPMASGSIVVYKVESARANYTGSVGGTLDVYANITTYTMIFSNSLSTVNGYVTVQAFPNMTLTVVTNIPNLIGVVVNGSGTSTLVWSGFNSTKVDTFAYINGTGTVYLEFANGSEVANIPVTIKVGQPETVDLTMNLYTIQSVTSTLTTEVKLTVPINLPKRYQPLNFTTEINGQLFMASQENITPELSYFNGSTVASLIWKGEGLGFAQSGLIGHVKANFETVEFYGVNGTALGYVHMVSFNGTQLKLSVGSTSNVYFGEEKIVIYQGARVPQIHVESHGDVDINGKEVIILVGNNGEVMSTALVSLSHNVNVNGTEGGTLVYLNLTGNMKVVVVTESNQTVNVSIVKPIQVQPTIVTIKGVQHQAQEVMVNSTGSIVFNVTLMMQGNITVYKEVSGEVIELNSSNYFVVNNTVVVYDDPTTTYFIVYSQTTSSTSSQTLTTQSSITQSTTTSTQAPQASTTQSSTTQSTAQTSSSQTSSALGNSSVSNVMIVPPSSSSTSGISTPEIAIIGIIIVIIVGALLIFVRKK